MTSASICVVLPHSPPGPSPICRQRVAPNCRAPLSKRRRTVSRVAASPRESCRRTLAASSNPSSEHECDVSTWGTLPEG